MREQARAKSAGRARTYAILPGLLLSAQWLQISLISNQPSPPQISHSHTKYYNSAAILGLAPASVPLKYRHLQEQTPSCQSIIASHRTAGEGLGGRGCSRRMDEPSLRGRQRPRRVMDHSSWISYKASLLLIWWCLLTSAVDPHLSRNSTFNPLYLWSYKKDDTVVVNMKLSKRAGNL